MDRIFELSALLGIFGGGFIASALGFAVGQTYQPATAAKRAGEAWLVAMIGGFLAHGFVAVLLDIGNDSKGTGLLVGWMLGFPGLFDTVRFIVGAEAPFFTSPENLLVWAAVVGTVAGGMHGAYRIYKWDGWGLPEFVADVTWGLLGTTLGTLLNLLNSIIGERLLPRAPEDPIGIQGERQGITIFTKGFATAAVLTQGSTVSNFNHAMNSPVLKHEKSHVLQNRVFGPFFTLTDVAWMLLWLVPALIADLVSTPEKGHSRVWGWCYYSNPWEVWGYAREGCERDTENKTSWSTALALGVALPFYGAAVLLAVGATSKTLLA